MEIYQGKIKFNDVATNPGKNTKRFFGQIDMVDAEGDINTYQIVSFRSQVISQSENLGKNGMSGKNVKVKGEFSQNTYNGNTTWQLKIEELFIEGMESLADDIKQSTDIQMPKKPSNVTIPTNPVAQLVENIPQTSSAVMPGAAAGYVYNPNLGGAPSAPSAIPSGGPSSLGGGGYVYQPSTNNVNNGLPSGGPKAVNTGGYVYKGPSQVSNINQKVNQNLNVMPLGPSPIQAGGYVSSTNQQVKVEKPVKEFNKFDDYSLPDAY